jgi:hypothetical protein
MSILVIFLSIISAGVAFIVVLIFGFAYSLGQHFEAGGTLGGLGASASDGAGNVPDTPLVWVLAVLAAMVSGVVAYVILDRISDILRRAGRH